MNQDNTNVLKLDESSCMMLGKKVGMSHVCDDVSGKQIPLTCLFIPENQIQSVQDHGQKKLITLGCIGSKSLLTNPLIKGFDKNNLKHYSYHRTFQINTQSQSIDVLNRGFIIDLSALTIGSYVDVTADSKGKGFAGVVKKYGHRIKNRSNVSLAHRGHESVGNRRNPGKVIKGRPMSGQMGNKRCTVENLKIYKIDLERSMIFVMGSVPGASSGYVRIRSSLKKKGCVL